MAKIQKMPPRKIAEILLAHLEDKEDRIAGSEIAGPGFINFFLKLLKFFQRIFNFFFFSF